MANIYPSINPYPLSQSIDMSINQTFYVTVQGSVITDYQILIYDITSIPNVLVHDTTKLSLSPNLSNNSKLQHLIVGGTIPNNSKYKWNITTWSGSNFISSRDFSFNAYTTPTISMTVPSTIGTQKISLTGIYSQAEGIPVNFYAFELYNSQYDLLKTSGEIYGFDLSYEFEGLDSPTIYGVRLYGENQVGMEFDTDIINFNVVYGKSQLVINPIATYVEGTSNVNLKIGDIVQINGSAIGSYSYNTGIYGEGYSLKIDSGSSVQWDFVIPAGFTTSTLLKLPSSFTGVIAEHINGLLFGYDGTSFYLEKGTRITYPPQEIYGLIFYVVITPSVVYFKYTEDYNIWSNFVGLVWQDILDYNTWDDVLKLN